MTETAAIALSPALSPEPAVLVVVPVYNHAATLRQVVCGALAYAPVLVVDDGSTDLPPAQAPHGPDGRPQSMPADGFTADHPLHGLPVYYVRHPHNQGKGKAVLTAAAAARRLGVTHIVTLDADAQHDPRDLPLFLEAIRAQPLTLFVGTRDFSVPHVPFSSRFGRAFSNFWYRVQTGRAVGDSQSGFRAYPLALLDLLKLGESRYSFETEVLVRTAWAGFQVADIAISVYYPPEAERVSHFHPILDNVRLTLLNTRLTMRAMLPVPQRHFAADETGHITPLHPLRSLQRLLSDSATPRDVAVSGALGVVIGTLPLIGIHSLTILLVLGGLRLNKFAGLATSQLCMPPFVPALCIETGYYLRNGRFLTEVSWQTLGYEGLDRLFEWVLGSLILAPVLGALCGLAVFLMAHTVRRGLRAPRERTPA